MKGINFYENYPSWIVFVSNLLSLSIYLIGAYIIYQIGIIWLIIYLCYIVFIEIRLWKKSCVNCYYFGKTCAFGKGRLSCLFFKKGDSKRFIQRKVTWKEIIPDFIIALIPAVIGIIILITNFNWVLFVLLILLFILISFGNGFVRGKLACMYCKQRELGCPAEQLFNKTKE
jgi:hypothetical protein